MKFFITKEELEKLYFDEKLTCLEIRKKFGINQNSIYYWFKKYDIEIVKFFITKEELEKLYFDEKLTFIEIEEKLGINRGRIYNWFKKYKITVRSKSECMSGRIFTEEHRSRISLSNSKPHTEIRKINISKSKIGKPLSEEHKEKIRKKFIGLRVGKKHPMWRGGTSILRNRISSTSNYRKWKDTIYYRDEFTCQMCYDKNNKLNCHHIETFGSIVDRYNLNNYEEYIKCSHLWDIDNGITLCVECHNKIRNKEKEYEEKFKNIVYEKKENV